MRYLFIGKSGAILLGFPDTTHIDDIIASKAAANWVKDRERCRAFGPSASTGSSGGDSGDEPPLPPAAMTASTPIRAEEPGDRAAVFRVNVEAFGGEDEARLVDALRGSSAFIPELSLVAVRDGEVAGHILFSRISISGSTSASALALAPMAVLPACQRLGIGSALVRHGLAEAARLGHGAVIVVGHPGYYPRFGFTDAARFRIRAPFAVEPGAFMALELAPGALDGVTGAVEYPPEFGVADATEANDS